MIVGRFEPNELRWLLDTTGKAGERFGMSGAGSVAAIPTGGSNRAAGGGASELDAGELRYGG